MEYVTSSVFIIAFVPMTIALGLTQLGRPFGLLYAVPAAALGLLAVLFRKNAVRSTRLVIAAALGQWFSLLSWVFSRHAITMEESTRLWGSNTPSVSKAGFPLPALEIPSPPMGGDVIPADMWTAVFANHAFWYIVAWFAAMPLLKYAAKDRTFVAAAAMALCFYGLVANLAMFVLWYD